jgi:hypothetical protein
MAATDPLGGQKFWFNGVPYQGVRKSGNETGGVKFWFNGAPVAFLLPGTTTPVFMRPDADDSDGGWTDAADSTTDLFASIDESTPSDVDYIKSGPNPTADVCRVRLSDPGVAVGEPLVVRYRYWKEGTGTIELKVRLMQGVVEIVEWIHSGVSTSHVTAEQTLSGPEFASITDFNDLFVEFEATVS